MSAEVKVRDDNFKEVVLESDKPVLVDFWAEWCVPCKTLGPIVEEIAEEYQRKLVVASAQVEDCEKVAHEYGIISIPTLMVFNKGELAAQKVGAVPKEEVEELFSHLL